MVLRSSRPEAGPLGPAPGGRERLTSSRGPLAGFLAGGFAVMIGFGLAHEARALEGAAFAGPSPAPEVSPVPDDLEPREKTYLKRHWGVEVMDVQQTAAGYMLEFRYRVLDVEKAKALFERRTKPLLTHAETGAKLIVPTPPTTGALRNSNPPIAGRIYWMLFANPGKLVKPGQHVNIEIGEFRVDGIVVH